MRRNASMLILLEAAPILRDLNFFRIAYRQRETKRLSIMRWNQNLLCNTFLLVAATLVAASADAQQTQQWQDTGDDVQREVVPVIRTAENVTAAPALREVDPQAEPIQQVEAREPITSVTRGLDVLPNDAGQIWRTYDISPYTARVTNHDKPQQAVVDWILRETGSELWFSEPLGILSASPTALRVYHTPRIQDKVQAIVDRLVASRANPEVFSLRLITLSSANWRSKAFTSLKEIDVKSPGVEAWLLSKENAAILLGELRKRADYQQHNAPDIAVHTGQPFQTSRSRPRSYPQSLVQRNPAYPFYDLKMATIDEGYSLEMSPLRSLDGKSMEAVVKVSVDQIEKFEDVAIEIPAPDGNMQKIEIQVPQVVSWRVVERFRWPANQVLLLSCGVVASPGARPNNVIKVPKLLTNSADRANALLFIDCKGTIDKAILPSTANLMQSTPNQR